MFKYKLYLARQIVQVVESRLERLDLPDQLDLVRQEDPLDLVVLVVLLLLGVHLHQGLLQLHLGQDHLQDQLVLVGLVDLVGMVCMVVV